MEEKIKKAIETYQCSGCSNGGDTSCFAGCESGETFVSCVRHHAGTGASYIGKIFLGMPKGFNRLGFDEGLKPYIYETFESCSWKYNKWNIPVWKYLSEDGHTFVRGIMPRLNQTFIHVFLEDCLDKIDCLEISQEDVEFMD